MILIFERKCKRDVIRLNLAEKNRQLFLKMLMILIDVGEKDHPSVTSGQLRATLTPPIISIGR